MPVEVMGMPEVGEGRMPGLDGEGEVEVEVEVEVLDRGVERRRKDMVEAGVFGLGGEVGGVKREGVIEIVGRVYFSAGLCISQHLDTDIKSDST